MRLKCKYCETRASGRPDGKARHLREHKKCLKLWEAGKAAGLFTKRSVEDAYHY